MDGRLACSDTRSEFVKLATRLVLDEGGEAEARDAVGREYYRHDGGRGHRNGYRAARLKSAEGQIAFAVPQVREALAGSTGELERLAIEMYVRGLSARDIEAAFTGRDAVGSRAAPPRSSASGCGAGFRRL